MKKFAVMPTSVPKDVKQVWVNVYLVDGKWEFGRCWIAKYRAQDAARGKRKVIFRLRIKAKRKPRVSR